MKTFLLQFFTWWNRTTLGTRFFTWRRGSFVGADEFGNRYYRAVVAPLGERRWVVYAGVAEPSRIPTGWHGWMHHTVAQPPVDQTYAPRDWQKPHRPNLTGTPGAYRPRGSTVSRSRRSKTPAGYDAWTPGG